MSDETKNFLAAADDLLSESEKPAPVAGDSDKEITLPANYSLEGLNFKGKIPLEKIVTAVKKFRDGTAKADVDRPRLNLLLSGAPGSGKSAFVRYLAKEVGSSLKEYRASDLLSRWIGETEKGIAKAFKEAKKENAILFIDEVDSFLQSRSRADHGWEVSQVNEMLQQMEAFGGVLVAATNNRDKLDEAVARRFTFKLELDYLTAEGKELFFDRYFKTDLTEAEKRRLAEIDHLTPGDFRTVKELLFYTCEEEDNAKRLTALEDEAAVKEVNRKKMATIGF